ncbi:UDP-glycosyltransferase 83A1-like [Panicum virgatum]|uniref:UDP-glycosyltransferase 83A1-like n=1 Tax=Panicum virgatum TaxID=38727 RepID=UPI0019D5622E|nr:UDP-glycosyltransferase 83A1-like [Panicum virgatum]
MASATTPRGPARRHTAPRSATARESALANGHILVLPLPAQGHVTPLMELSHRLVDHGFEVTFVNTEAHHARVVSALQAAGGTAALAGIHLASISDGLESDEDRKDIGKVVDSHLHMPGRLEFIKNFEFRYCSTYVVI